MLPPLVLAAAVLLASSPARADAAPAWAWPVEGAVVGAFHVTPRVPYGAGQRRGLAIAAGPGALVRSACGGRVAFAGPVGAAGPTLSVDCPGVRATYQGLAALLVDAGATVAAGQSVARVSGRGRLRLGARLAPGRYVDPLTLLRRPAPPLGPAPRPRGGRAPRRPAPPVRRAPQPRGAPVAVPLAPGRLARRGVPVAPASSGVPALAWVGIGLLAAGLPAGAVVRRRARRRRAPRPAPAAARAG